MQEIEKKNYYQIKEDEDIFTTLLKTETELEDIFLNAIYLKGSIAGHAWSYYVYFYDKVKNICYINDLNFYYSSDRLSVTNTIEQLATKILPYTQAIQSKNLSQEFEIPQFVYFYNRGYNSTQIIKQLVSLEPVYDTENKLLWFSKPSWKEWNEIWHLEIEERWSKSFRESNNAMGLE